MSAREEQRRAIIRSKSGVHLPQTSDFQIVHHVPSNSNVFWKPPVNTFSTDMDTLIRACLREQEEKRISIDDILAILCTKKPPIASEQSDKSIRKRSVRRTTKPDPSLITSDPTDQSSHSALSDITYDKTTKNPKDNPDTKNDKIENAEKPGSFPTINSTDLLPKGTKFSNQKNF